MLYFFHLFTFAYYVTPELCAHLLNGIYLHKKKNNAPSLIICFLILLQNIKTKKNQTNILSV